MRRAIIGSIIIALGVLMFMEKMGMVELAWLYSHEWHKYIVPVIIVLIGIKLVCSSGHNHRCNRDGLTDCNVPNTGEGEPICLSATWAGNKYNMKGQVMKDIKINAFMGGMKIDMREADFTHDCVIEVQTMMGGAELLVPRNIRIEISNSSLIGGVGNHTNQTPEAGAPTLFVKASCFMGGVDLKN